MNKDKKRHPYATLAILTLAGASAINLYHKAKNLVKNGVTNVSNMVKRFK